MLTDSTRTDRSDCARDERAWPDSDDDTAPGRDRPRPDSDTNDPPTFSGEVMVMHRPDLLICFKQSLYVHSLLLIFMAICLYPAHLLGWGGSPHPLHPPSFRIPALIWQSAPSVIWLSYTQHVARERSNWQHCWCCLRWPWLLLRPDRAIAVAVSQLPPPLSSFSISPTFLTASILSLCFCKNLTACFNNEQTFPRDKRPNGYR